jgi:hypothetical protein
VSGQRTTKPLVYSLVSVILIQGCTNPGHQVAVATKFGIKMPNICLSSVRKLLHVTIPAPRILRLRLDFKEMCTPALINTIFLRILCDNFIMSRIWTAIYVCLTYHEHYYFEPIPVGAISIIMSSYLSNLCCGDYRKSRSKASVFLIDAYKFTRKYNLNDVILTCSNKFR